MKNQFGNALWFILIAIVLLGLLTISLSRTSNNNETGNFEQRQIAVTEILRYAKSIENAVQSLLVRGCSENDISFENNVVAGYINANSPADNSCHIFEPEGAGMTYLTPKLEWLDSNTSDTSHGQYYMPNALSITGIETSAEDLVLILPLVNENICSALNNTFGIAVIPVEAGVIDNSEYTNRQYKGQFSGAYSFGDDAALANNALIDGESSLCIQSQNAEPVASTYHFYHVLYAR